MGARRARVNVKYIMHNSLLNYAYVRRWRCGMLSTVLVLTTLYLHGTSLLGFIYLVLLLYIHLFYKNAHDMNFFLGGKLDCLGGKLPLRPPL